MYIYIYIYILWWSRVFGGTSPLKDKSLARGWARQRTLAEEVAVHVSGSTSVSTCNV